MALLQQIHAMVIVAMATAMVMATDTDMVATVTMAVDILKDIAVRNSKLCGLSQANIICSNQESLMDGQTVIHTFFQGWMTESNPLKSLL